jgi:allene oxide cyclase
MRKPIFVMALVVVVVGSALTISFARNRAVTAPTTLSVIEHAVSDKVIDTGKAGDTSGDLLTFNNPIYDSANKTKVGHDQGDCIRISPKQGTWECRWLTFIAGRGAIMVEGAFFDGRDNTIAITGGTMEFRNARGSMKLVARKGGYDFVFMLLP